MSPTLIVILVLVILVVIAGLAFAAYKAGFRVTEATINTGLFETKMERPPAQPDEDKPDTPTGLKIKQQAVEGGTIKKSGISAPADSAADIDQKAKGDQSKIDDSPIKLT